MTVLRIDPWDPDYGASIDSDEDPDKPPPPLEFDEPVEWRPILREEPQVLPCCAFVDGVRRIDLRLFAEEDELMAPAIAGSWGVGVAWSSKPPSVGAVKTGRVVVVGGGLEHPVVEVNVGGQTLRYEARSCGGRKPIDPLIELQQEMRRQEEHLASSVAEDGLDGMSPEVIVQDGPLNYFANSPTVGLIKRQARAYLQGSKLSILSELQVRQRTPIFRFESVQLERYSWYSRIGARRRIDGTLAGLVRLEVPALVGLSQARRLADMTTSILPSFTAPAWRDSRSPQNLYPVGQLETVLRHRLGDPDLIRRELAATLWRSTVDV